MAGAAIGGLVVGTILWTVFAGVVARAVPERWHCPERMAARMLAMPMWDGGQRLMQVASPDAFAIIAEGNRLIANNRDALENCRKQAAKAHRTVSCAVSVDVLSSR